jgi:hypothetical protein
MSTKSFLQRDKFPQCCGATILSGFGYPKSPLKADGQPPLAKIKKFLTEIVDLSEGKVGTTDRNWHEMERNAFHMAILNDFQKQQMHDTFIAAGFELVMSNGNGHSHADNHLYVRKVEH